MHKNKIDKVVAYKKHRIFNGLVLFLALLAVFYYVYLEVRPELGFSGGPQDIYNKDYSENKIPEKDESVFVATHISTPDSVKAIYMTSWVAGTKDFRDRVIKIIDETEVNAVVIDIKDYTGRIAFKTEDPLLQKYGASENRIPDVREFIKYLHDKNIYVIGRISVFQDPHMVTQRPDLAVKRKSDGNVWKDYKGISWLEVGSQEVWDYVVALAKESYNTGFDELNFDYIRFPSDGNMQDITYAFYDSASSTKAETLRDFFSYLYKNLSDVRKDGATLSADLFGMITTNKDDLNIGQVLEFAEPYFDYIAPMVYPSHYPAGFQGYANPASEPYGVVKFSMGRAVERLVLASTTPSKLRPWLQDFDLGAVYDANMVRAQMQAVYDVGLDSWMLWDPKNIYTRGALLDE